jgi:hypothetical protein
MRIMFVLIIAATLVEARQLSRKPRGSQTTEPVFQAYQGTSLVQP